MVHLANTKGNVIIKNSSGIMNFKGKYKTKPLAFNTLLKKFKFKIRKIRNYKLAMHVLGIKKKRLIATRFKFFTFLGSIKSFNLVPFNGCREKKRKRKKNKRNLIIL
jgi:ribosomal protein S11